MWYSYNTFARYGWIQTWSGDEHFPRVAETSCWVLYLLPARQAGVMQMVFSCQCRSSCALTSWHGPKSICRAACIQWERNAYFLLFTKWCAKYIYQEISLPAPQHFTGCSFKKLVVYCNPDMWPSTKRSSTMTLLCHVSLAFGKLVLIATAVGPRASNQDSWKAEKPPPSSSLLLAGTCWILQLQNVLRPLTFLQQNSWPIWKDERDLCQAQNWESVTSWRNRSTNSRKFKISELWQCPLVPWTYFSRINCSHYWKLCFSFGLGYIISMLHYTAIGCIYLHETSVSISYAAAFFAWKKREASTLRQLLSTLQQQSE